MKYEIGQTVKVTSMTDDTANGFYVNQIGTVVEHNSNGATGNTEEDPLHMVQIGENVEAFWYEELTAIAKPSRFYNVWVDVEAVDEETGSYDRVDELDLTAKLAVFENQEDIATFLETLNNNLGLTKRYEFN